MEEPSRRYRPKRRCHTSVTIDTPTPDYRLTRDGDLWVAEYVESSIASHGDTLSEVVWVANDAARLHAMDHTPGDEEYQRMMLDRYNINFDGGVAS